MSNENAAWITTPRQYRPTYSYLAQSTSSNFGVPSIASANNAVPLAKRRRTTSTFPVVGTHSAPTVAASGYTASVLSHDISHPTPNKPHRLSIQTRAKTPSRIPTPTASHKRHSVASFVSVVSAGSSGLKENIEPRTHRLLGPIPPGQTVHSPSQPQHGSLTKSRTMTVISNITSPFSRSTGPTGLPSSRASLSNLSSYIFAPRKLSLLPASVTEIRQVTISMPTNYWLGRFQCLNDQFRAEHLEPDLLDSPELRQWYTSTENSAGLSSSGSSNGDAMTPTVGEEILAKKVFLHLEALCLNNEATKSFKAFQLVYARKLNCAALLPPGGTLTNSMGPMARAGRLFSGGAKKAGTGHVRKRSSVATSIGETY